MSLGSSTGDLAYPAHVELMHKTMLGYSPTPGAELPRGIMAWLKGYEMNGHVVFHESEFKGLSPPSEGHGATMVPDNPSTIIGSKSDDGFTTTSEAIKSFLAAISNVGNISWVDEFDAVVAADVSEVISSAFVTGASEASDIVTEASEAAANEADTIPISDIVQTYEDEAESQYNDSLRRFNTAAAFAGATDGSNFALGRSIIEAARCKEVNKFEASLKRQAYQNALGVHSSVRSSIADAIYQSRTRLAIQGTDTMVKVLLSKASLEKDLANIWMESNMQLNQARVDYTERNLEHTIEMSLWPLRIYQYAVPLQSPGGGMGYEAGRLTRAQSALSGAAAVAGLGATIGGEKYGKLGAGIGALIGGAAGWYGY